MISICTQNFVMGYDTNFKFDEWIKQHDLQPIQHLFIKHNMTTIDTLSNETNTYRYFLSDTELRSNYSYLIPNAVKAIAKLHKKHKSKQMSSNIIHVIDEEKEHDTSQSGDSYVGHMYNNDAVDGSDDDPDVYNDMQLIRKHSLELCNETFSQFITKYLKKKMIDKIWPNLDVDHKGYIESVDALSKGIWYIAVVYKKHIHQENGGSDWEAPNDQHTQKQADQIALWIAKSYGSIARNDSNQAIEYKYRVTKTEFQHSLAKWIEQYAESEGTM